MKGKYQGGRTWKKPLPLLGHGHGKRRVKSGLTSPGRISADPGPPLLGRRKCPWGDLTKLACEHQSAGGNPLGWTVTTRWDGQDPSRQKRQLLLPRSVPQSPGGRTNQEASWQRTKEVYRDQITEQDMERWAGSFETVTASDSLSHPTVKGLTLWRFGATREKPACVLGCGIVQRPLTHIQSTCVLSSRCCMLGQASGDFGFQVSTKTSIDPSSLRAMLPRLCPPPGLTVQRLWAVGERNLLLLLRQGGELAVEQVRPLSNPSWRDTWGSSGCGSTGKGANWTWLVWQGV